MKIVKLEGKTFGRLTVIKLTGSSRGGSKLWECSCVCGNKVEVSTRHLNRKNNVVRSCGCLQHASGKESPFWGGVGEISGQWWGKITRNSSLLCGRVPLEVTVTMEEAWELFLKQDRRCKLSGVKLWFPKDNTKENKTVSNASLDRVDSSRGYTNDNIQWVHKRINLMKGNMTDEKFIEMCSLVSKLKDEVN